MGEPIASNMKPNLGKVVSMTFTAQEHPYSLDRCMAVVGQQPFTGSENPNLHLPTFLEVCGTFQLANMTPDKIKVRLFPLSLVGHPKQWYHALPPATRTAWTTVTTEFLAKYFPPGKTQVLKNKILRFTQRADENIGEALERFREYKEACPHHGLEEWELVERFYTVLNPLSC